MSKQRCGLVFTPDEAKLVISFWVEATSRAQHKGASRLCSRASPRPLSLPPTTKNRRRLSLPVPHTGSRAMASARAMRAALQKIAERLSPTELYKLLSEHTSESFRSPTSTSRCGAERKDSLV